MVEEETIRERRGGALKFVRIGENTIRLDMIVRIQEGRVDETLYGRSVRKSTDRIGWIEVHFVAGEAIKFEGQAAAALQQALEEAYGVRDLTPNSEPEQAPDHALPPVGPRASSSAGPHRP